MSDFYSYHPASERVRVRCAGGVAGSTLEPPGEAASGVHGAYRECTLIGHTRCKQPLGACKWQRRGVDTPLMLLCADGSHGLDLSFVTHIFMLGRVDDPAIKQQVVSRADRMGALPDADGRGCEVETLLLWHDDELRSPVKGKRARRA